MSNDPSNDSQQGLWTFVVEGIRAAIPIAVGYLPIGITFGLLARAADIPTYITMLMSLVIFAGASQFVGINLIALGSNCGEILVTTFVINLRHLLMSASLAPRIEPGYSKGWLSLMSFGITDETFTVASTHTAQHLKPEFLLGLNLLAFTTWNIATWIGLFLAAGIPAAVKTSMGIALYVMFIGLLAPACRHFRAALFIALAAMLVHSVLYYLPFAAAMAAGLKIVCSTVIAALLGAMFFPGEEDEF